MYKRIILLIFFVSTYNLLYSQLFVRAESGIVFPSYNDVAIPGNTGTKFSLKDDLKVNPRPFFRLNLIYESKKHHINLLYAPLSFNSEGQFNEAISFQDYIFPANTELEGFYKFNSYRLTYRYKFVTTDKLEFGFGISGKIRDAEIKLSDNTHNESKTDLGFVPLFSMHIHYFVNENFKINLEGEALGAKQGRAEDFILSLNYKINENIHTFIGYRVLEGGSDGSSVYTFAWFNYYTLGINIKIKKPRSK